MPFSIDVHKVRMGDLIELDDAPPPAAPPQEIRKSPSVTIEIVEDDVSDDDRNADEILLDMNQIDEEIYDVRFKQGLQPDEILEKISELMERRNHLNDKLQKARNSEFRQFVDSLQLGKEKLVPFFPTTRKCKLRVSHDEAAALINNPPVVKSRVLKKSGLYGLAADNFVRCDARAKEINTELSVLRKKKLLSPSDVARKDRLEAEMDELNRFLQHKK